METNASTTAPGADQGKQTTVKMVPESDLLAIKSHKESLEQELKTLKATHDTTLAEVNTKRLAAEARAEELQAKFNTVSAAADENERNKKLLEAAQESGKVLTDKALGWRRELVAKTYNIPSDTLKEKSLEQLDTFEEALKAIGGLPKGGNYAVGGGGAAPAPESSIARAQRIIAEAEERQGIAKVKLPKES